jgi:ABC-2 type transport system permease protein
MSLLPSARDLHDTGVIARRELLERVRSKWFVLITLLGPIGMIALAVIPALLLRNPIGSRIDIIDRTGALAEPLSQKLTDARWKPAIAPAGADEASEMAKIRSRAITGFLVIPADALDRGKILYRGDNGSNPVVEATLRVAVQTVVVTRRGAQLGVAPDKLEKLFQLVEFKAEQTNGAAAAAGGKESFLVGYAVAYILFLVIAVYAVAVMRSVVQEKTSRVMELMIAAIKPRSLMTGKILGVGAAGLIQVALWLAIGAVTLAYRDEVLGLFGVPPGGEALPPLAFGEVAVAIAFFVLGYFFYASMYAAVGAMVSTEQDTQQVQMPITILMLIGMVSVTAISGAPRGLTAEILTTVPLWSALLMPMRYVLGGATLGEVVLSAAILLVSTVVVARAAARIYRVGVLMYGKRPSVTELWRWLRY